LVIATILMALDDDVLASFSRMAVE
jgi:hypothetical protein